MNITKTLAEEIAKQMVEPLENKLKELRDKRAQIAYDAALKSLPKDLLDCHKRFKSYFKEAYRITLHSGTYEKLVELIAPIPSNGAYYPYVDTDVDTIKEVDKICLEIDSVMDEKEKVYNSVVSTLLALRTFKRAKENFPEAYKYMSKYEEEGKTVIALPIDNIMDTLKKYSA